MKKFFLLAIMLFLFSAAAPAQALRTPGALQVPDKWREAKTVKLWWSNVTDVEYYKVQLRTKKDKSI
ncbi:MAG: hypothetical protein Q8P90_02620 [bacterium]|nr:hypothetical protein [bacterium]